MIARIVNLSLCVVLDHLEINKINLDIARIFYNMCFVYFEMFACINIVMSHALGLLQLQAIKM